MVAVGCSLFLGGCSWMSADAPPPTQQPAAVSRPAGTSVASTAPTKPVRPQTPPASASPPTPAAKADPAELVGLSEADVRHLLGAPRDEHPDGAARVQTYAGDGCSLDIVLFLDVSRSEWAVLSYDLTPTSGKRASDLCYGQMRGRK